MELGAPGLETDLISLEALSPRHHEAVRKSGAVNDMWRLMPVIPSGCTIDAYFDHTVRMAELGTGQGLAVILKETGDLIGIAAYLVPNRLHRRVRIGYTWLAEAYRGAGIAPHIQYLMLKRALEWRARRVEWMMSMRSDRALASMERLGIKQEGILRQYTRMADGSWADVALFSVIDDEIRQAIARLGVEIGEARAAAGA